MPAEPLSPEVLADYLVEVGAALVRTRHDAERISICHAGSFVKMDEKPRMNAASVIAKVLHGAPQDPLAVAPELPDKIEQETDVGKRMAMIAEATKLYVDDYAYIPLHQQAVVWAARKDVDLVQLADNTFPLRFVKLK